MQGESPEDRLIWLRQRAQRLLPIAGDAASLPEDVLRAVCGVQAQDLPAALLALGARGAGPDRAGLLEAMSTPGRMARTWAMRGTLHLLAAEDARWLVPFFGPRNNGGDERRFRALGWDEAPAREGLQTIHGLLDRQGSFIRAELVAALRQAGLPADGQAPVHLLYRAANEGILCQGPPRGADQAYAAFAEWAGPAEPLAGEEALARLAARYLAAYAPAGPPDFAVWSGVKAGEARAAFRSIVGQTVPWPSGGEALVVLREQEGWLEDFPGERPLARLLPRFDNILLGYTSRAWAVSAAATKRVHPGGGLIAAVLLVDGRARGLWHAVARRAGLEIVLEPFEPLDDRARAAAAAEAQRLGLFLGKKATLRWEPFNGGERP